MSRAVNCPCFDRRVQHEHERLKPVLEDMLMSNDDVRGIEVITGVARRRYWPADDKLRIIEESRAPGESVSAVARRNGVAPNLLFRWRRLMDARTADSPCPVVRRARHLIFGDRRHVRLALDNALKVHVLHELGHRATGGVEAFPADLPLDLPHAVDPLVLFKYPPDLGVQGCPIGRR